jgi:hypothetical protein
MSDAPVCTTRQRARPSATTKTPFDPSSETTAAAGTVSTRRLDRPCTVARANPPTAASVCSGRGTAIRSRTERLAPSATGMISRTVPAKLSPGSASSVTLAGCPARRYGSSPSGAVASK